MSILLRYALGIVIVLGALIAVFYVSNQGLEFTSAPVTIDAEKKPAMFAIKLQNTLPRTSPDYYSQEPVKSLVKLDPDRGEEIVLIPQAAEYLATGQYAIHEGYFYYTKQEQQGAKGEVWRRSLTGGESERVFVFDADTSTSPARIVEFGMGSNLSVGVNAEWFVRTMDGKNPDYYVRSGFRLHNAKADLSFEITNPVNGIIDNVVLSPDGAQFAYREHLFSEEFGENVPSNLRVYVGLLREPGKVRSVVIPPEYREGIINLEWSKDNRSLYMYDHALGHNNIENAVLIDTEAMAVRWLYRATEEEIADWSRTSTDPTEAERLSEIQAYQNSVITTDGSVWKIGRSCESTNSNSCTMAFNVSDLVGTKANRQYLLACGPDASGCDSTGYRLHPSKPYILQFHDGVTLVDLRDGAKTSITSKDDSVWYEFLGWEG